MSRIATVTPQQIIAVGRLLDEHVTGEGLPEGSCRYVNGWSDERVAKEAGISGDQAKRLRLRLKGQLQLRQGGSAARQELLELAAVVSKTALAVAELAAKLGEHDLSKILRGLAQDATLAE